MAYATLPELKSALDIGDTSMDTEAQRAIDAASRGLDKLTHRRPGGFEPDAAPSTRRYTAISRSLVIIDDIAEIDDVISAGTSVLADVTPEPLNADADSEPFTRLTSSGLFSRDRVAIEVIGTFGWPAVPEQVEQWVLMMASRLLKRLREAPFGLVTGSFDGEVMRLAREDPDTSFLVGRLTRQRPLVA